jgi:exportin-1
MEEITIGYFFHQRMLANNVLNEYMELPNSWLIVDKVLDNSPNPNTKFYALSLLEKAINVYW